MKDKSEIVIRLHKDAGAIARLNEHVHQPHHLRQPAIFAPYDYDATLPFIQGLLSKDNSYGLIAYRGEEPIGYAIVIRHDHQQGFFQQDYRTLFIDQMAVKSDCQGQGIGEKLIEAVAKLGREEGIKRIELNVWTDNQGAVKFYERCGFKPYTQNMCRES
jgi:ribosomal protein S18 acetylase RimI-like enzyme